MLSCSSHFFSLPVLAIFGFIILVTAFACRWCISKNLFLDNTSERSSHEMPTSRAGGLCMMVPLCIGALLLVWQKWTCFSYTGLDVNVPLDMIVELPFDAQLLFLIIYSFGMSMVGLIDDYRSLRPVLKFLGQFILAFGLVIAMRGIDGLSLPFLGYVPLGWFGYVLGVFWIVAFVNVFNFMDGLNGMASGVAIVAALALIFVEMIGPVHGLSLNIPMLMIAALVGFFFFNIRGRIFMGDSGSMGLGFLFAGLALYMQTGYTASISGLYFLTVPIIFLPFILDVAVTLYQRIIAGKPFYEAHKEHLYQRLQQSGRSHAQVSFLYIAMTLICAMAAVANAHFFSMSTGATAWITPVVMIGFVMMMGIIISRKL